jgi:putative peptidoglycan lipid II flippase
LYLGQNYYIPIYSNIKYEGSKKENELFNKMLRMFFFAGFILSLILLFLSNQILSFYLSGSNTQIIETALVIFRIFIFTIPLNAAISIISAHLQSQEEFSSPALAQLFANLSVILLVPLLGRNIGIIIIPIAYLIGSLLQMFFLLNKSKKYIRLDFKPIYKYQISKLNLTANASLMLIIVIEVISQFYFIIDRYFYDKVEPGGIAALNYAITVYYIPIAVLSVALSTAIFPSFSDHLQQKDPKDLLKKITDSLSMNAFLFAPIVILFIFYGDFVIRLFFQRGNFSHLDTQMTFSALRYFSLSLIFYSVYSIFNKIFYGARLIKHLLVITMAAGFIKLVLNFVLVESLNHDGLALSSSIAYSFLCISALMVLKNKLKISIQWIFWRNIALYISNALISYVITQVFLELFSIREGLTAFISILFFLSIYIFNMYLIKDYSISLLKGVWISYRTS